jgi:MFS superfamily sulfate permease-like transporter
VHWLVVDAEAITNIDYSASRMVRQLHTHLVQTGVEFAFARVATSLHSDLVRHRLVEVIGPGRIFHPLHEAVAAFATEEAIASKKDQQNQLAKRPGA